MSELDDFLSRERASQSARDQWNDWLAAHRVGSFTRVTPTDPALDDVVIDFLSRPGVLDRRGWLMTPPQDAVTAARAAFRVLVSEGRSEIRAEFVGEVSRVYGPTPQQRRRQAADQELLNSEAHEAWQREGRPVRFTQLAVDNVDGSSAVFVQGGEWSRITAGVSREQLVSAMARRLLPRSSSR